MAENPLGLIIWNEFVTIVRGGIFAAVELFLTLIETSTEKDA